MREEYYQILGKFVATCSEAEMHLKSVILQLFDPFLKKPSPAYHGIKLLLENVETSEARKNITKLLKIFKISETVISEINRALKQLQAIFRFRNLIVHEGANLRTTDKEMWWTIHNIASVSNVDKIGSISFKLFTLHDMIRDMSSIRRIIVYAINPEPYLELMKNPIMDELHADMKRWYYNPKDEGKIQRVGAKIDLN